MTDDPIKNRPLATDETEFDEPNIDEVDDDEETEDLDALNAGQYLDDISDDSVRLYLREIGKIPLLNAEEEMELAHRVIQGDKKIRWLRRTCGWWCRLPSGIRAVGWIFWI